MSPQTMPSETEIRSHRAEDAIAREELAIEEDARLRNDIRLLGRILGDTVRDQEGADVFDLVERIRQTSIRFHRDDDKPARRELELILNSMSISQTVRIVRAFSYFSHLANIAEDQNNIRQMRARSTAGGAPRSGTLAQTLSHARAAGFSAADLRKFFMTALVSPVLTAHPTEVRRKSTIDREMEIAALLDRRERIQLTPEELAADDEKLRREVLTLWQTNLLRRTKLTVLDEVANGLSFYDYTFLHEVPRLHCVLEDRLNEGEGAAQGELASFLRLSGRDQDTFDVMHESVLRGWPRLAEWMEEENRNVGRLRELVRVSHEAGWRPDMTAPEKKAAQGIAGLTLRNLIDWRNHFHPTGVWASRYIDAAEFETALDFLNWSEAGTWNGERPQGRQEFERGRP